MCCITQPHMGKIMPEGWLMGEGGSLVARPWRRRKPLLLSTAHGSNTLAFEIAL